MKNGVNVAAQGNPKISLIHTRKQTRKTPLTAASKMKDNTFTNKIR
jgi:hypothetical protein